MKIEAIGTGSAFARPPLYNASLLLTSGNEKYLVDCGGNVPIALEERGIFLKDLAGVLLTHIHLDHIGGIEEWAFKNMYLYGRRTPLLIAPPRVLDGVKRRMMPALNQDESGRLTLQHYFRLQPAVPQRAYRLGDFSFTFIPVRHVLAFPSYALYFKDKKRGVFFSADALFDAKLIKKMARAADVIIHDCQLFRGGVHASMEELQTLPASIKKKILCHHYGNNYLKFKPTPMKWLKQGQVI